MSTHVTTDVSLVQEKMMLMPQIKDDPSLPYSNVSEGKLLKAAIAAYRNNNLVREKSGREPLSTMVIPCTLIRKT